MEVMSCLAAVRSNLESVLAAKRQFVLAIVFLILPAFLILNLAVKGDSIKGDDGPSYERLGYEASLDPSPFDCGNFYHSYWSPGWVATIGYLYRVTDRNPFVVRTLVCYFAIAGTILVYLLGRQMGETVGLLASGIFALSTPIQQYSASLSYEVPASVLALAGVYIALFSPVARHATDADGRSSVIGSVAAHMFAGVLLGYAALMAGRQILLAAGVMACVGLVRSEFHRIVRVLAIGVGVLLVLVPWVIRNERCFNEFIPLTTNAGINLYIGNNPWSTNGYFLPEEAKRPQLKNHESREYFQHTINYIGDHKMLTLSRMVKRLYLYWKPQFRDQYYIYIAMAVGWIRLSFTRRVGIVTRCWLIGVPIIMSLFHAVFFIMWRYVIVAWPYICVSSAIGILGIDKRSSEGRLE